MFKNILIVCIGNVCRSPMAAGLFAASFPNITVVSAGLAPLTGEKAQPFAIDIMSQAGISIQEHRASSVTDEKVRVADLILVMDLEQKRQLSHHYPQYGGKILRLGEWIDRDIPDPFRGSVKMFEQVFSLIQECQLSWTSKLRSS